MGGLSCLGWVLLSFPGKLSYATALRFALANLLLVGGLVLVLARNQAITPWVFWLHFGLGDVLLVLGVALFRDGLRVLLRLPDSRYETFFVPIAYATGIALIPYPNVSIFARALPFSIALVWLALRMTQDCLHRSSGHPLSMPHKIAAAVFVSLGLVMATRAAALVLFPEQAAQMEATSVRASVPFLWASTAVLLAINNALAGLVLSGLVQRINHLATHDTLTGCLNRRALDERLRQAKAHAKHNQQPLGLVMFDIDHFKRINDRFGHLAGDAVLQFVAKTMQQQLREGDVMARWGGEEFLVLLPHTDQATATTIAQRMQKTLANAAWSWQGCHAPLTASFSVMVSWCDAVNLQALDQALYRAKALGRNRVELV